MVAETFVRKQRAHAGTRRHNGQPFAKILSKSHCTATDELRTYKMNPLGKTKWRNRERAPGQPIESGSQHTEACFQGNTCSQGNLGGSTLSCARSQAPRATVRQNQAKSHLHRDG